MKFLEYTQYNKTYIVHHTTGFGEEGNVPYRELEVIYTTDNIHEAHEKGREMFPAHPSNWTWDRYTINVNVLTQKGRRIYEEFIEAGRRLERRLREDPEDFIRYEMDGTSLYISHISV